MQVEHGERKFKVRRLESRKLGTSMLQYKYNFRVPNLATRISSTEPSLIVGIKQALPRESMWRMLGWRECPYFSISPFSLFSCHLSAEGASVEERGPNYQE